MDKQDILQAELIGQQMEEIERQIERADEGLRELQQVLDAVRATSGFSHGDEMLVPIAGGLYTKATFAGDGKLLVNVGQGVVVPKSADEVMAMIQEQREGILAFQGQLRAKFDELLAELKKIEAKG